MYHECTPARNGAAVRCLYPFIKYIYKEDLYIYYSNKRKKQLKAVNIQQLILTDRKN